MTKVLLAEDDKFLLKMSQAKLIKSGYDVLTATNGDQVLQTLETEKPDVLLLDLIMPIKNGFDTLQEIRKQKKWSHLPIIILSNLGQESDIQKGMDLGATDYLIKSNVSIDQVVKIVEKHT